MAWQSITNNPNWEYDTAPPDPGGALTALWATGTNGIRTNPYGEEIFTVSYTHLTLPTILLV